MSSQVGSVLVDYTSPDGAQVTHVRSTLIASSLQTLRELQYFDRYFERLPREHRDEILLALGPAWLPLETALAHYRACEALDLTEEQLGAIGTSVTTRLANTLIATFLRSTRAVGGSPWLSLEQSDRMWSRLMRGGAVRVTRRGPKEAMVEVTGLALFELRYFSLAFRSALLGGALLFSKTAYLREQGKRRPHAMVAILSWV
jgi:hypothetical protein